ncbi:cyclic nucleotide-binding domain-containing protein [Rossellomorea marisflavi]|uniref:Crp/Fnr family transcriptional regulator n=1 Tax=Rossellomorea marisflavi TaxID=189381 RepID=UPI001317194E|nr:Crp/Fnr family transcriptional regulator [Rossellomorea marisflavi]QHA35862.1 cyclic nucleotide-binding domain-containing protein [Rossellomorea marisflavi]
MEHIPDSIKAMFIQEGLPYEISKGSYLFLEGKAPGHLFFIREGHIKVTRSTPGGRELALRIVGAGDVVGEIDLFCGDSSCSVSARAMDRCFLLSLPITDFEAALLDDRVRNREWMMWSQLQQRKDQSRFRDLLLHGKKGALYSTLIRLSNTYGDRREDGILIGISLTNQDLADFCGASREVVNRMLHDLKDNGVITMNKGFITIHKLDRLKETIDCDQCPQCVCQIN